MLGGDRSGAVGAALTALLLSAILTPLLTRVIRRFRPLSVGPESPLPRAGLAIGLAFVVASLLNSHGPASQAILLAAGLASLWGLIEDVRGAPPPARLLLLTVAAALLIRAEVALSFLPSTPWGLRAEWGLTALWVVGLGFAFPALDRLHGLAAGTAAINALFMVLHALTTGQGELGTLAGAFLGATLGFLPYNFRARPREAGPSVALGAAGGLFLGVGLGGLAVLGEWAETPGKDLLVPVLILAVPWLAVLVRVQDAARVSQGARRRLALWEGGAPGGRPLGLAIRRKEAVALLWLASLCFGSSALLFRGSNPYDAFLILGQVAVVFGIIGYALGVVRRRAGKVRKL